MGISFRFAIGFALFSATAVEARAEGWRSLETSRIEGEPLILRKTAAGPSGKKVTLNLVVFSTADYTLKVVDQGGEPKARKYSNLREGMERTGCVAGVNGGFYGADFKALGAVVADGISISPFVDSSRNGLTSGVIWSGVGGIHIVRRQNYHGGSGVRQAIQTGPMLISNGTAVTGLSISNFRPRTFVLTDWKGKWMIGTSSFVTLAELAELLNSPGMFGDLKVNRAINLDGGRSTGLYVRQDNGKVVYRPEISRVRNFLGIIPK